MDLIVVYKSNDAQSLLSALIVRGYKRGSTISYINTFGKTEAEINTAISNLSGSQDYCFNAVTVGATGDITTDQETALKAKLATNTDYSNWVATDRTTTVDRVLQAWNEITGNKTAPFIFYEMADLIANTTASQRLEGEYAELAIVGKYNSTDDDDDIDGSTAESLYPIIDRGLLNIGINSVMESGLASPIVDNIALENIISEGEAVYGYKNGSNVTVTFTVEDGSGAVEDATITIDGQTADTDASGKAEFTLDSGTNYYYTVAKTGYATLGGTVTVSNGEDVDESVTIIATSVLTVTVADGKTPLENAVVTVAGLYGRQTGETDARGEVEFTVGYGDDIPVSASLTSYTTNSGVVTVDAATETLTIQLTGI